ncbi:MAG TPA: TIGR03435 family protein [Candidatus Sulfopaludibacter sp.]|jgi:uncharacterized protein (TIGR03435 family)|nr:TIGR03435 family protein [Candidatus Sulfopaludibacter sp.]
MRILSLIVLVCAIGSAAASQTARRLEFDVASVKVSPKAVLFTIGDRGGPGSPTPGTWSCDYCSLRDLLGKAFAIQDFQVVGPTWLGDQRFHVSVKLPRETGPGEFREMLRNLLIDRFALAAHFESREMVRYELAVEKNGPKLPVSVDQKTTKSSGAAKPPGLDADGFPQLGPPSESPEILTIHGRTSMFFPGMTMVDLADELSFKLTRPVTDVTDLRGTYDIRLHWSVDDAVGPDLKQALHDQLGLRLVEKRGPVDTLNVQHVEKLPTAN